MSLVFLSNCIWNKELSPSWRSNYTTNINLQMNYWMANVCNLY
ncbi:MAG: glycosyl hydrolase family 95 catalytic domain-containing protein, partial [Rheinheimera sp.]